MGKVAIHVDRNYKYRPGERPWFYYENGQEYSEQQVEEHTWRVKYLSGEFLRNYIEKAIGSSTFTRKDQEEFSKRQNFSHPALYSIPQFILNHPMGAFRQSSFKDVWRVPGVIATDYTRRQNPWESNFLQLAELNKSRKRKDSEVWALSLNIAL